MAITGIDTIEGKQIIAAGAVSAKSAEMAYNDENGNPITGYQIAGDYLTTADSANFYPMTGNPSGFINELPEEEEVEFEEIDLAAYQPVSSMTAYANSANVTGTAQYGLTTAGWSEITAGGGTVPTGIMVESGLEYDANNKISGYSGSAFAGGTELEFEYDAANNISAINSSAISTTPAQALYAQNPLYFSATGASSYMGINNADLARMLGVDETLLYSGNAFRVSNGGSFNVTTGLSENVSSFNKIIFRMSNGGIDTSEIVCTPVLNGVTFNRIFSYGGQWVGISGAITGDGMSANIGGGNGNNAATCHTAGNWWDYVRVESIYGIGRKEV